ncbi:UMP-CMP kinase-like isoform X1 [Nymphaea colorata]|nr:UMP-CMP kinase-like isoform X1 [Nymphaea colorata]
MKVNRYWWISFLCALAVFFFYRARELVDPTGWNFVEVFRTKASLLDKDAFSEKELHIAFVLGGPGSGKGTQCAKIVEAFGFTHLSAGELLRREIYSNSKKGEMIRDTIKEGKIVPSDVTVSLIKREIQASENDKFLIDGFPRSEDNRVAFEHIIGAEPELVLFLECPEEEMIRRVLNRNQGRIDDNIETIEKRLKVFNKLNFPVINYYDAKGKLRKISAVGTIEEVFEKIKPQFSAYKET